MDETLKNLAILKANPAGTDPSRNDYYRDLFNSVRDGIFVCDVSDEMNVVDLNSGITELTGFTIDDFPSFKSYFLSQEAPFSEEEAKRLNRRAFQGEPQTFEWLARKKDKSPIWVEAVLKRATLGGEDRMVCVVRDITLRKKLTEKLEAALKEARTANRTKDMFLANISQELRPPLSGILRIIELLQITELSDRQRSFLDIILGSASLLMGIINGILTDTNVRENYRVVPGRKTGHSEALLSRLEELLKDQGYMTNQAYLVFADLTLWPARRAAYRSGNLLQLTPTEFNLLHLFMRHPCQVLSKEMILQQLWSYDFNGDDNVVEVFIRYLRRKLGDPPLIRTRRGAGYILEERQ